MIYRFGSYTLDTETFELKSGADVIAAEPKVFLLLKYLIENRARVVSRDEIIDAVWDGLAVSDSALTYAIKEARRLTGDDGKAQTIIKTLPKLGFRFVAEVTEGGKIEGTATPQGNGASPADDAAPGQGRRYMPALVAALALVAIIVGGLAWWQPWIEREEPLDPQRLAFPIPEKLSIAVLPFDNLSGDPKLDFVADSITDIIITKLSKIPQLLVIARNSSFTYKGKAVKVKQVAEELGVRYVLEGSVQRSGGNLRINVQLIDALTGHQIWAEIYDRRLVDLFDLQDEIAIQVVTELEVKLTDGERARVLRRQTNSTKAYEQYLIALEHFSQFTKSDNAEAHRLLRKALELDPNFVAAWTLTSVAHGADARFGWSDDRGKSRTLAVEAAKQALAIDDTNPDAHFQLANAAANRGDLEQSIPGCERALSLEPPPNVMAQCGRIWTYVGREQEALELIRAAMRRDPYFQPINHMILGHAHYQLGNFDEAVAAYEIYRDRARNAPNSLGYLAISYVDAGRMEDARATVEENIKRLPRSASIKWWKRFYRINDPEKLDHVLNNLRKAGMPEE
jgi:TolB-like protein/DNA-binding winged helix-turn-helix (wHTH) protein